MTSSEHTETLIHTALDHAVADYSPGADLVDRAARGGRRRRRRHDAKIAACTLGVTAVAVAATATVVGMAPASSRPAPATAAAPSGSAAPSWQLAAHTATLPAGFRVATPGTGACTALRLPYRLLDAVDATKLAAAATDSGGCAVAGIGKWGPPNPNSGNFQEITIAGHRARVSKLPPGPVPTGAQPVPDKPYSGPDAVTVLTVFVHIHSYLPSYVVRDHQGSVLPDAWTSLVIVSSGLSDKQLDSILAASLPAAERAS